MIKAARPAFTVTLLLFLAASLTACGPVINDDLAVSIYRLHEGNVLICEDYAGLIAKQPEWKKIRELQAANPDVEKFRAEIEKQPELLAFFGKLQRMLAHLAHSEAVNGYVKILMKKDGE